jgi:GTP cyclohydrolase I
MPVRRPDAERAIRDFLSALGHNPESPELSGTPRRVVDAFLEELLSGYSVNIQALLTEGSEPAHAAHKGIVVVRNIDVSTVCPHHLMPALGEASVAYAPGSRILGLGTIAHLTHAFARRLSLQEKIGEEVTSALMEYGARGAFCQLTLRHSCLSARGAEQHQALVTTTTTKGSLRTREGLQELELSLGQGPPT